MHASGEKKELPLIPLRNMVVFPQMIVPLFIGRDRSMKALQETIQKEKTVIFASQKKEDVEEPSPKDIAQIGTLSEIVQLISLPDGTTKVLVEGIARVRIDEYVTEDPYFMVRYSSIKEEEEDSVQVEAQVRRAIKLFEQYVRLNKKIPSETLMSIINVDHPGRLADLMASYLTLKPGEKQSILEAVSPLKRLAALANILEKENEVMEVEKKLQGQVRQRIEKVQKDYYLKEKLKAIQTELGEDSEEPVSPEIAEYKKKIENAKLTAAARDKAIKELDRLKKMPPMVAEATVIRTYLDWLIELPWKKRTKSKLDLAEVERILNEDHHGLDKVKERIQEYFAVLQLTGKMGGTILCLVGPPGVGKTSIASSIAKAMGRKFTRVALGGVRDEAEIRGHRRTYVGALPGRIIQSIHKVGVSNPVFLLDEIDKMGNDFRGDPAAALLEVLDPEQNKVFSDHYLEVDFDLSDVFFITTANTQEPIPRPLRDRMEIIEMSSYTEAEKVGILKAHLIPKLLVRHGFSAGMVEISVDALLKIVQEYTREAGVRNLERTIATVLRKIAVAHVKSGKKEPVSVGLKELENYLGVPKHRFGVKEEVDQVGSATGLVWTEVGGDTISIEVTVMKGRGSLTLTGQLGEVMQESAKAAMSFVRTRAAKLGLDENLYRKIDVHIHVPEGAVPKDGPSAGITIATALTSAMTGIPIRRDVAMTGEITLRGKVLPIGGLKEKVLAARRAGMQVVILPEENKREFSELKPEVTEGLKFHFVKEMEEVLPLALTAPISPKSVPGPDIQQKDQPDSPGDSMQGNAFA